MVMRSFSRLFLISCIARNSIAQAFISLTHQMRHSHIMSSSAATTFPHDDSSVFRILCLHGKGGNGDEFLNRLLPLRTLLDESLASEKRKSDDVSNASNMSIKWEALTAPYQISDTDPGYAWWSMPPGVRSFNADEYIGFDESASNVMSALLPSESDSSTTTTTECNYDLILGHSQGAILVSALLSTNSDLQRSNCSYILNGAAWPNPYSEPLNSLSDQTNHDHEMKKETKMLFVMGKNDTINPIESAKQVHDCYQRAGLDVSIVYHEGGHSLPSPNGIDLDSERALKDICNFLLQAVSEKSKRVDASNIT